MCNSPCATKRPEDGRRVVVKHTFIEVVDSPRGDSNWLPLKRRTQSDSFLCKQGASGETVVELAGGASDADTNSEATQEAFSHRRAASDGSSGSTWSDGGMDAAGLLPGESTPCGEETRATSATSAAQAGGLPSFCGADIFPSTYELEADNARLAQENAMLHQAIEYARCQEAHMSYLAAWMPMDMEGYGYCEPMGHLGLGDGAGFESPASEPPFAAPPPCLDASAASSACRGGDAGGRCRAAAGGARTTVMLRNLPNNYTRAMLLRLLDEEGFSALYDFVYMPIDFRTQAALGYAFVNLVHPDVVRRFWNVFDGFSGWVLPSKKVCFVSWCDPNQGLEAHIDRYRNSPVMHDQVPDEYKPVIFRDGVRAPFPRPSKAIRAPRVRGGHGGC